MLKVWGWHLVLNGLGVFSLESCKWLGNAFGNWGRCLASGGSPEFLGLCDPSSKSVEAEKMKLGAGMCQRVTMASGCGMRCEPGNNSWKQEKKRNTATQTKMRRYGKKAVASSIAFLSFQRP